MWWLQIHVAPRRANNSFVISMRNVVRPLRYILCVARACSAAALASAKSRLHSRTSSWPEPCVLNSLVAQVPAHVKHSCMSRRPRAINTYVLTASARLARAASLSMQYHCNFPSRNHCTAHPSGL